MSATLDRLRDSVPPLVTPFKNGAVDYDVYARLVALQFAFIVHLPKPYRPRLWASSAHVPMRLEEVRVPSAAGYGRNQRKHWVRSIVGRRTRVHDPDFG
jgi:hypothetical protein